MIEVLISTLNRAGLIVTLYLYAIIYDSDSRPKHHINGFPKNVAQYTVPFRTPGFHPEHFQSRFDSKLTNVDSPSSRSDGVVSNVSWITSKLTRQDSRQPMWKVEESIGLITCIVDLFTPLEGSVLDSYAGTRPTAIVALASNRSCTSNEKDDACFHIALSRVGSLAMSLKKLYASCIEDCSVDPHEIVREISQSDDVFSDSTIGVLNLRRMKMGHQHCNI